jgi:uncharacterized protein (TIGR01244 family)
MCIWHDDGGNVRRSSNFTAVGEQRVANIHVHATQTEDDFVAARQGVAKMKIQPINHQVSVSDQLTAADLKELKALGVSVIVCNRPDAEAPDQADFAEIAQAAAALAIKAVHLPFTGNQMTQAQIDTFAALLKDHQRLHAYCRTGNRSSQMAAASERQLQAQRP